MYDRDSIEQELEDEILAAMFNGIPAASTELVNMKYADDDELAEIARRWGINTDH